MSDCGEVASGVPKESGPERDITVQRLVYFSLFRIIADIRIAICEHVVLDQLLNLYLKYI